MLRRAASLVLTLVLLVGACGDSDSGLSPGSTGAEETAPPTAAEDRWVPIDEGDRWAFEWTSDTSGNGSFIVEFGGGAEYVEGSQSIVGFAYSVSGSLPPGVDIGPGMGERWVAIGSDADGLYGWTGSEWSFIMRANALPEFGGGSGFFGHDEFGSSPDARSGEDGNGRVWTRYNVDPPDRCSTVGGITTCSNFTVGYRVVHGFAMFLGATDFNFTKTVRREGSTDIESIMIERVSGG